MSKIVVVSYANSLYYHSAVRLKESIKKYHNYNQHYSFSPWDIDLNFEKSNTKILTQRGGGWFMVMETLFY